jgi:hypothetical protein
MLTYTYISITKCTCISFRKRWAVEDMELIGRVLSSTPWSTRNWTDYLPSTWLQVRATSWMSVGTKYTHWLYALRNKKQAQYTFSEGTKYAQDTLSEGTKYAQDTFSEVAVMWCHLGRRTLLWSVTRPTMPASSEDTKHAKVYILSTETVYLCLYWGFLSAHQVSKSLFALEDPRPMLSDCYHVAGVTVTLTMTMTAFHDCCIVCVQTEPWRLAQHRAKTWDALLNKCAFWKQVTSCLAKIMPSCLNWMWNV